MKKVISGFGLFAIISFTGPVYAYDANCMLGSGKQFNIHVSNKVMVVDNKSKVFYKGKSGIGLYEYENNGYKYSAGKFDDFGHFSIEVRSKNEDKSTAGACYLVDKKSAELWESIGRPPSFEKICLGIGVPRDLHACISWTAPQSIGN